MSKSPPRLGKGLRALVTPRAPVSLPHRTASPAPDSGLATVMGEPTLRQIPSEQITSNPRQPRTTIENDTLRQLAASIRTVGVLQPILVRSLPDGRFELVAGERRWRAAQLAGLETVPAIIREVSDKRSFEIALIENLQREDLDPLERAGAYQQLIDTSGATIDQIASRLGESRASVSNYLRLLSLGDDIKAMITSGELGMGHARAIAGISNPQRQLAVARLAVRRNLSVRQVEALAKDVPGESRHNEREARPASGHLAEVEGALSRALGLGVQLVAGRKKNSGRVVIRYNSLEEFDRIAERLSGQTQLE